MNDLVSRIVLLAVVLAVGGGADWPQFRGPGSGGISAGARLPPRWGRSVDDETSHAGDNIAWRVELPGRGVSSPIVVASRVVVTCSSGPLQDRLHVLCFDARSGKLLWQRQFWATGRTFCHPTSAIAANTPGSDGQSIFAFFSSNDLISLDLDGNLRWLRGLTLESPTSFSDTGLSSSPLVVGPSVIVQVEEQGASFVAAIDKQTGRTRWQVARKAVPNWVSPAVLRGGPGDKDTVLLQSPLGLAAHDAETGQLLWQFEKPCEGIASPMAEGGVVYVPSQGLAALRPVAGATTPEVLWNASRLAAGNASPVVHDHRVYVLNRAGALTCADTATGEIVWRLRIKGTYWATPVLAGEYLYFFNQQGLGTVVRCGEQGKIVSQNEFTSGEEIFGSPAVFDNALFVRTDGHLWKIAATHKTESETRRHGDTETKRQR
jgi:outer membrane protein assembly factor BamB